MTYSAGVVTFSAPAFRTLEEAQAWAELVYGWAVGFQIAFNALLSQTRRSQAAAITSLSAVTVTDPAAPGNVTDPADAPASADALRDDLVTNTIPSIESILSTLRSDLVTSINEIEAGFAAHRTAVNAALASMRTNLDVAS